MYHSRWSKSPYEAGYRFGAAAYQNGVRMAKLPPFPITLARQEFMKACLPLYRTYFPEILEEIQGIADGQQTAFEEIAQILFNMYCIDDSPHCTCLLCREGDQVLFGRNSDFLVSLEKWYDSPYYRLAGKYSFLGHTTAFSEIEDGINEYGLVVGLTFLYPTCPRPGLNAGMLVRMMLEQCRTVQEAEDLLFSLPIASAQTIAVADSAGDMAVFECNAKKIAVRRIKKKSGFLVSANCFQTEEMRPYEAQGIDNWRAEERVSTANRAFSLAGRYDIALLKGILSGQYGFMCQYNRKQNADTVWSVIYDLTNQKIYRTEGNPSRKKWKEDHRLKFHPL